jgi:hypothetical protein
MAAGGSGSGRTCAHARGEGEVPDHRVTGAASPEQQRAGARVRDAVRVPAELPVAPRWRAADQSLPAPHPFYPNCPPRRPAPCPSKRRGRQRERSCAPQGTRSFALMVLPGMSESDIPASGTYRPKCHPGPGTAPGHRAGAPRRGTAPGCRDSRPARHPPRKFSAPAINLRSRWSSPPVYTNFRKIGLNHWSRRPPEQG